MKILFTAIGALLLVSCGGGKGKEVAAVVNGQPVTLEEVDAAFGGKVAQRIHEMREQALDSIIDQKILEAAAKKENLELEEFLKKKVDDQVSAPTEAEVRAIYDANKDQFGTFEEAQPQIANILSRNRRAVRENELLSNLRKETKVEIKLEKPPVQRVEVSGGGAPGLGSEKAKVTLIEFSDYQCPFCGRSRPTVNRILETYKDDVRYVFRDFPLSFHRDAFKSHVAAHCAGDQGKYWEYNKTLFANQSALKEEDLKKYATETGLEPKAFNECLAGGKHDATVNKGLQEGEAAGVSGTPAFFINGIPISGAQPFEKFKSVIDDELKK